MSSWTRRWPRRLASGHHPREDAAPRAPEGEGGPRAGSWTARARLFRLRPHSALGVRPQHETRSLGAPRAGAARAPSPHAAPEDRVTLTCGNCRLRIAWWTVKLRSAWLGLQDANHRGWKWQGQGPCPIRFRGELVDAACGACGWAKLGVARQPQEWWTAPPEML
jgi:hypothetical protein